MGKKLKKRIFSVLLTIVMLVGLIPANTFCVFARPIEPEEVVIEVTSWDEFVEAFKYSSYEGESFTIKLMNNLYANAINTSRDQTAIISTSIKGSYVTFDFNGHTLSCTDEVSDTDLDYSLSDFIRITMHPLGSTTGSELRFIDSKGGGGVSMTSSRAYDSELAALHIVGNEYYVNSVGITQSTGYVNNKVIFEGGEYKLSAKTKKFGRGTLDRGVYYRGCVIADWLRAEVNDGIFIAESDGVTSLGRDMCARELSAFATCCSTMSNPSGIWNGYAVINGGLFMSDGYSVHHFDNYYELNGTRYMNFPIINAGAFKGGLGFTGHTFIYADGCEQFNEKPATDIISADGYVKGVDGDGDIYDNIQDFTLEDLHDVKSCYILSEDVFNMSTSPKIQDESVELERYMGQTETFNINYEVPLWVQRLGLECNPTISVVGENSQITEETDTLEVSYKDFLGKTKVTLSLLIKNMTIPVCFDKEYNINVTDIPNNAVIVLQPRSCDVEPGEWAEATVIANNALSYQWYYVYEGYNFALTESFLSQFDNMNIEGYNSPTLRMKFNDGYVGKETFYCVVTGNDEGTVKTDKVTFTYGSKPTVIGLSGGTYYADEDATFTLFGNYMENITWKVMHKMSGNMSIYSLDEFAELMGIEYSVKHQKFNNKLYRAEVTFSNVPESVSGKYFVGYYLSNDLGEVSFNTDDTVAFTVTEITPEILEVIENQTCNEGGTLTYSFKANNMTSADWTFEKDDEDGIAIAYTIEDMKELFPDTIFTEESDGENATLTIENVSHEMGEYLLYARAMGESASTYVGCALISVRDVSIFDDIKASLTSDLTYAAIGEKINLSVNAEGGSGEYTYKFAVLNVETGAWTVLKDFGVESTYIYEATEKGSYQFAVTVKDSLENTSATNRITVTIDETARELTGTLTVNDSKEKVVEKVGSELVLKVETLGGSGKYTYKYAMLNVETGAWTILKDFCEESTYTYKVTEEGSYQFAVTVKDSEGNSVAANRVSVEIAKVLEDISAKLNVNSSSDRQVIYLGDKITLNVDMISDDFTYKYAVLDMASGEWKVLRPFTKEPEFTLTLNKVGVFQFASTVKNKAGKTLATNRVTVEIKEKNEELSAVLKVNDSTDNVTVAKGANLTFNANASGGSGNYTYKFAVLNVDNGKWSVLKDFSSEASYTYALNYPGTKQFAVTVKDSTGKTVATNRITVVVSDGTSGLTGTLLVDGSTEKITASKGTKVTLTANASGGSGSYTYKFAVLNVDNGKWSILKDFGSEATYTYALNYPGTKQFAVTVKDSTGKTVATNRLTVVVK